MQATKADYKKFDTFQDSEKVNGISTSLSDYLKQFCDKHNLKSIINLEFCSSTTSDLFVNHDISFVSCGMKPHSKTPGAIDLTKLNETQIDSFRQHLSCENFLVTCFNVLEFIDIEDLSVALYNLYNISNNYLIVSINNNYILRNDVLISTILPISTWKLLFKTAGFDSVKNNFADDLQQSNDPEDLNNNENNNVLSHWRKDNIFHDLGNRLPHFFLLKKRENHVVDWVAVQRKFKEILDIGYKEKKRFLFNNKNDRVIGFNIHFFQDYNNIRPLLDVIDKKNVVILIRKHFNPDILVNLYTAIFSRWGVRYIIYERVDEIDWTSLQIDILVSAAESNVYFGHALSAQLVNAAKLNGIETLLLQHGIWTLINKYPIRFESDKVLYWSDEQKNFMDQPLPCFSVLKQKIGSLRKGHVETIGAPRFFDAKLPCSKNILSNRLGIPKKQYDKIVMLATNLHWDMHAISRDEICEKFRSIIEQNKNIFFIVKPHPSESSADYSGLTFSNCLVIDDIDLAIIDLTISRIIAGVDAIISSLSTILLDGAVAGKKVIQYDTHNKLHYSHLEPVSLDALRDNLSQTIDKTPLSIEFCLHYAGHSTDSVYQDLSNLINEAGNYQPNEEDVSIASYEYIIESLWIDHVHGK